MSLPLHGERRSAILQVFMSPSAKFSVLPLFKLHFNAHLECSVTSLSCHIIPLCDFDFKKTRS